MASNRKQLLINIIYVVLALFLYNSYMLELYKVNDFTITNRDYVLSQYAFTYQNMGFVARGLLPSIFELIKLNNKFIYYIFYNIVLILYIITIIYIAIKYAYQYRNKFIIAILFLYFGVFHFSSDTMRTDMLIILISFWLFILLNRNKILPSITLSIVALLIHEASFFLIVPVYLLFVDNLKQKIAVVLSFGLIFLIIILFSNKTTESNAIEIIKQFGGITQVKQIFYIGYTAGVCENIKFYFSTINNYFLVLTLIAGTIIYVFCFREVFKKSLIQTNIFALFPLLLCFVAIDYFRWLHFAFILLMLYSIRQNLYNNIIFKRLIYCLPISIIFNPSIVIITISLYKYFIENTV